MKRLLYLAALSMVIGLVFASVALAQSRGPSGADGTYNCPDFDTQAEAQAFLRANPSDPHGLDGNDDDGIACESLPAPYDRAPVAGAVGNGVGGGGGQAADVDCADVTFEEAQAILAADPTDPNRLDADNDGVACEVDDGTTPAAQTQYEPTPATAQYDQYAAADQYAAPAADDTAALPATGGPALLLPAAGMLLLGAGLIGLRMTRRS